MATQDDSEIPLEISNQQQNLRLLELPPSLLALIVSKDPPKYVPALSVYLSHFENFADTPESLWLKSAESPSADVDSKQSRPNAVLCTDDATYQLRQVQSSNSILILQPSESRGSDNEIPSPSLSAIAQCTATLELIPSDTTASFANLSRLLRQSLPLYNGIDTDVALGTDTTFSRKYKDRAAILQDAPFSAQEFDNAWKQLCAFELLGRAWLPTPSAVAMLWKSIMSAATIKGVNLEKEFDLNSVGEMVGNDGFPLALFKAVVMRLVSDTDFAKDDCVMLSRDRTVEWVGSVCLQKAGGSDQANTEGISQLDFLTLWHDLLPEGWREHASLDLLKAKLSHPYLFQEKIVFRENIYDPTSSETLPSAGASGKASRKWHEKFKMGRK